MVATRNEVVGVRNVPAEIAERGNLRQHMVWLCKGAEVDRWAKLFVNLRASCNRDLQIDTHVVKMVARWVDNSPDVIMRYCLAINEGLEGGAAANVQSRLSV